MSLHGWLAGRSDRCACGYHVATQGCRCRGSEWTRFVAAVREAADPDGTVHLGKVRPLIVGRIAPRHVGQLYRRARSEGLLIDTGEREPSTDVRGRNTDKLERIYRLATEPRRKAA